MNNNVFNCVKYAILAVSTICNLKCKHCITFTPYHRHPQFFDVEQLKKDLERFFRLFGRPLVHLDLGGGEPLLHPRIVDLTEFILAHHGEWFGQMRILTNGSVRIPKSLLDTAVDDKLFFLIDNYGPKLSTMADKNEAMLKELGIPHRVNKYFGDDQYFNGWIDFGELEFKNYTPEQLESIRQNCFDIYSESEISQYRPCDHLHIKNGKIHYCDVQQVGASHIPVNDGDFIDLRSNESDENLIERLKTFKQNIIETCKYCNGFIQNLGKTKSDARYGINLRVHAAIQLTNDEIKNSHLDCH